MTAQWSQVGRSLYGTWMKVFGGGVEQKLLCDPLGLEQVSEEGGEQDWIRSVFEKIDADQSGTIEYAELENIVLEMTGSPPDKDTVQQLLVEVISL